MIVNFNKNKTGDFVSVLHLIKEQRNPDFYYTKDNLRHYINNEKEFKVFLRQSVYSLVDDNYRGFLLIWKSVGGDQERNYLKFVAEDSLALNNVLNVLFWNYGAEVFVKVKKQSPFLNVLRKYKFNFVGGRGKEILLKRDKQKIYRIKKDKV